MTVFDLRVVVSRLDPELRKSLEGAVGVAVSRSHATIQVEHWLSELIAPRASFAALLRGLDVAVDRVAVEVARRLDTLRGGHEGAPSFSPLVLEWIQEAWVSASLRFGRDAIEAEDLVVALTNSTNLATAIRDVAPSLRFEASKALGLAERALPTASAAAGTAAPAASTNAPAAPAADSELARYTIDLTEQAASGRLDPVVGREAELRQVVDILMRRRQNNPILTGEAGVGKTAVVEALALRIAEGTVPEQLRSTIIRSLDLGLLQAGAGVKGEFERRLTGVIAEIKAAPRPTILFIDEAHVMIGAGNQSGGSDAANLLKPALARGELRTIAATTWSEYKRHIERDPALTRRFQVVKVEEPSPETAVRMLRGIVPSLERHHGVHIKDAALREAVALSARHLPDRQLPDKAISVLDTAAAGVSISRTTDPAAIEDLTAELRYLGSEREAIARDRSLDVATELAAIDARIADSESRLAALQQRVSEERVLVEAIDEAAAKAPATDGSDEADTRLATLEAKLSTLQGEAPLVHRTVDRDAVAAVIARWTGVPVGRLVRDSIQASMTLEARLRTRVVGQDRALAIVAATMRSAAAKLVDPRKPPGVFLMVGTSGVGKTETALALADQLFGGQQHLSIINMSEFKEEHKVSSLVGSPPGYVGYGEGGVLTEAVRRRPYGLLLMDEVEKAHPGVQDVFYQVFDKGLLRDGEGRDIAFLNTTIILTSNAGSETLAALAADPETMPEGDALVAALRPELAKHFKPAFLGRVTIVPYLPLTDDVLRDIADLQIGRLADRLKAAHGTALEVDDSVRDELVARCVSADVGARAIESALSLEVLPLLSDVVLDHALRGSAPRVIRLSRDDGHSFIVSVPDAPAQAGDGDAPLSHSEQPAARPADCGHMGDHHDSAVDLAQA